MFYWSIIDQVSMKIKAEVRDGTKTLQHFLNPHQGATLEY